MSVTSTHADAYQQLTNFFLGTQREQTQIEKREMAQLKKVSPLTSMCDSALDNAVEGSGDLHSVVEGLWLRGFGVRV